MRVAALALIATGAGCADPGATGTSVPAAPSELATPGVRVEGSATLLHGASAGCWTVEFDAGDGAIQAPLAVPAGFSEQHAVMADPMRPGSDFEGVALIDANGQLLAIEGMRVVIAAQFHALDDADLAAARDMCGWTLPPLVPDQPWGIAVDPDGIDTVAVVCRGGSGDQMTLPGEPLADCTTATPTPYAPSVSASTVPAPGSDSAAG